LFLQKLRWNVKSECKEVKQTEGNLWWNES
jgi:hypothetical protein